MPRRVRRGIVIAHQPQEMFNVSPFASLTEVNRMLSAWGIQATAYEPARGGVENLCLIIDTAGADSRSASCCAYIAPTPARACGWSWRRWNGWPTLACPCRGRCGRPRARRSTSTRARRRRSCRTSTAWRSIAACPRPCSRRNIGVLLARTDLALAAAAGKPRRHRARHHRPRLGARSARHLPQDRRLPLAARRGRAGRRRPRRRHLARAPAPGDPWRRLAQQHPL